MKISKQIIRLLFIISLMTIDAFAQSPQVAGADLQSRPIRFITPFPAGGSTDVLARMIAPELSKRLGTPVIVDNKVGASGMIGLDVVAKAAPDGYTLGLVSAGNLVITVMLTSTPLYDPVKDLVPVAFLADSPVVLVATPALPVKDLRSLIALERTNPGSLFFATSGNGTTQHLAGELFNVKAGTQLGHVPYKGGAPAITDILGGQISLGFLDIPSVAQYAKAGRVKLLGVAGRVRAEGLPDAPTIAESGIPGYDASAWFGVVAPAKTPAAIIQRLSTEFVNVMKMPSIRSQLLQQGLEARPAGADEFATYLDSERAKWGDLVRLLGPKLK